MDKEKVKKALEELNKEKTRKFKQKFDLIIVLKHIDIKKEPIDFFSVLPHPKGKKASVCALVGPELEDKAKTVCDEVVRDKIFNIYKDDPKKAKSLGKKYDYFIAQANLMAQVATVFGKILGQKGKMPNPKAGCVLPPTGNIQAVVSNLQKTVRVSAKTMPVIQVIVGSEEMKEDDVIENILAVYNALVKILPNEEQNIKEVLLKKTMSKPVKV
ncbi:hypothetical protein KY306_01450 [Candidatus Woesearchaeota archaeon]|nr:hypothetical protein [Candidatus Woesearchaeota archaeon]